MEIKTCVADKVKKKKKKIKGKEGEEKEKEMICELVDMIKKAITKYSKNIYTLEKETFVYLLIPHQ